MKYTLKKDWVSPSGKTFEKGRILDVTPEWIEAIEGKKKEVKTKNKEGENS